MTNKQLAIATGDAAFGAGTGCVGKAGLGDAEEQEEEGGQHETGEHGEILFARCGELCRAKDLSFAWKWANFSSTAAAPRHDP